GRSASTCEWSRSSGASGSIASFAGLRRAARSQTTTSPSSVTPSRGTSPTTRTPNSTSGTTARPSSGSTRNRRRRWTTRRGASCMGSCRICSSRTRRRSGSTCTRAWSWRRRASRGSGRICPSRRRTCPTSRGPSSAPPRVAACGGTSSDGSWRSPRPFSSSRGSSSWSCACSRAIPLGLYAATRHRRAGDYVAMVFSQIGIAIPSFWAGLLLILLFSVRLGWVQSGGFEGWSGGLWSGIRSLLLPAIALGLFQSAVLVRATRSAVLDVLREEYVRTARAKGVREALVLGKHTLRNALIPIVTVTGIQLGQLMAGSIILESVFALPGLGRLALGAITARDLPVVQGVTLFVASSIVLINFAVDLAYVLLDPRIRYD